MIDQEELSEDIQTALEELCDQGSEALDEDDPEEALIFFRKAEDILPKPADQWEVFGWLQAAQGDACYSLANYGEALEYFENALDFSGEENTTPFILQRLGQCHRQLGHEAEADRYLQLAKEREANSDGLTEYEEE